MCFRIETLQDVCIVYHNHCYKDNNEHTSKFYVHPYIGTQHSKYTQIDTIHFINVTGTSVMPNHQNHILDNFRRSNSVFPNYSVVTYRLHHGKIDTIELLLPCQYICHHFITDKTIKDRSNVVYVKYLLTLNPYWTLKIPTECTVDYLNVPRKLCKKHNSTNSILIYK